VKEQGDIYIYKMVTDNGGAPCVYRNRLSLAICKPKIRSTAGKGAWIFGFGSQHYGERLIYVARVTKPLDVGEYYTKPEYASRPDCIYREANDRPERKSRARYHHETDEREHDVGMKFEKSFVILSDDFRYLGRKGTDEYKRKFPAIRKCIEGLKRGHRRYHSDVLREELLQLRRSVWRRYRRMRVGFPIDQDTTRRCNSDCGSGAVG
jgi:Nucleotide modification associated domain 2